MLETGNFGHNRDASYQKSFPYLIRTVISLCRHTWDVLRQMLIFPLDALRAWRATIVEGIGVDGPLKYSVFERLFRTKCL